MRFNLTTLGAVAIFCFLTACTTISVSNSVDSAPANSNLAENVNAVINTNTSTKPANVNVEAINNSNTAVAVLTSPLDRPSERITKKLFGTYITPQNSPVQPERFTGFHTGVDYETFASEAKSDVPVVAACTGKVRARQTVSGYGGVLVQDCMVAGQKVTVLYGHLRLSSISVKVGTTLKAGTQFAVLGTGYSSETSDERKHLHFSLHRGTAINWRGYVSTKAALGDWLDPMMGF